jgi:hypothetical protein
MPLSVLNVAVSKVAQRILGEKLENLWQIMSIGRIATRWVKFHYWCSSDVFAC